MSALGQKQTFAAQNGMSALPLIADVAATFASTKTPELSPEGQMATNQIDQAACFRFLRQPSSPSAPRPVVPLRAVSLAGGSATIPHPWEKSYGPGLIAFSDRCAAADYRSSISCLALAILARRQQKTPEHFRPRTYAIFPVAVSMWLHLGHTNVSNS